MGWTAVTNHLDAPGLVLFGVLFFWQVPHFIAISIFRQSEYDRAGLKVLPSVRGIDYAKRQAVLYTACLVVVSLMLFPLRVAGYVYLATAAILGSWFLIVAIRGLRQDAGEAWSKKLFVTSLVYLTVLFAVLMIDAR